MNTGRHAVNMCHLCSRQGPPTAVWSSDLGSVPLLSLLHVGGRHGLILDPDVSQSGSQVWFGHIQVHVHLLGHDLFLQLTQLLGGGKVTCKVNVQAAVIVLSGLFSPHRESSSGS